MKLGTLNESCTMIFQLWLKNPVDNGKISTETTNYLSIKWWDDANTQIFAVLPKKDS